MLGQIIFRLKLTPATPRHQRIVPTTGNPKGDDSDQVLGPRSLLTRTYGITAGSLPLARFGQPLSDFRCLSFIIVGLLSRRVVDRQFTHRRQHMKNERLRVSWIRLSDIVFVLIFVFGRRRLKQKAWEVIPGQLSIGSLAVSNWILDRDAAAN